MSTPVPPAESDLFPDGRPATSEQLDAALEQFKLILGTVESLESRRQTLHAFFMSINSFLLAAIGLIAKQGLHTHPVGVGVILLGLVGSALSVSWRQQILFYGRVTSSKWEVINAFEVALPARPFAAEWKALQRRGYRPFTRVERLVPDAFTALYAVSVVIGALVVAGVFHS